VWPLRIGAAGERDGVFCVDVVGVDVHFEHVSDLYTGLLGQGQDAVDIPLWVDDECDLAVVREVAAVAASRGLDQGDGGHRGLLTQGTDTLRGIRIMQP